MPKKKKESTKRQSQSLRTYSFLITIALLAIIVGASYYTSLPKVEHIPDQFGFNSASWMTFIPQNAEFAAFVDYQQGYTASGNPFLFGTQPILQFYQVHVDITPQSILYELDIQLPHVDSNSVPVTVSVIKLRNDTSKILISELSKTTLPRSVYDGYSVYSLLIIEATTTTQPKLTSAYVAIADGILVLSIDPNAAKYGVQTVLDQYSSSAPSLFDNSDVRRGVYASGAADKTYIGLFVGTFSTQFNNTRMIVKSVVANGDGISVTRSVLFPSPDLAMSSFGYAHNVYRDAASYQILDQWLVVSYNYSFDKLRGELTGI